MPEADDVKAEMARALEQRGLPTFANPSTLKNKSKPAEESPSPNEVPEPDDKGGSLPPGVTQAMVNGLRRAGWCAIVGIGLSHSGPLRLASSTDPGKLLREARMHNLGRGEVAVQMLLYLPGPEVAARVRDDILDVLRAEGSVIRASLVSAGVQRLDALVRMSAVRIGTDATDARTAARAVEAGA